MNIQEIILKVTKLLAKGNNAATTPEESAAFLAKAQQIIDEHKLDISTFSGKEQNEEDNEPVIDFGYEDPLDRVKYGRYRETWTRRLGSIVSKYNQTRIVYTTMPDKSIIIRIIGRSSDVQIVRYLYSFFKLQVEGLVKEGCKGQSSAFLGQFCMGVLDTLHSKLEMERQKTFSEKRNEQTGNSMALIRVNDAIARIDRRAREVDEFLNQMANLKKGRNFAPKKATEGREAGRLAGERIRTTRTTTALGNGRTALQS